MIRKSVLHAPLAIALLVVTGGTGPLFAQPGGTEPVVYVTAFTGQGATRGVSGPAFPVDHGPVSAEEHGLSTGQSIVTPANGTAVLTLPGQATAVRLDPSSELRVGSWGFRQNDVPATLTLTRGRAYILRRRADGWLVVAVESSAGSGYALSKSRELILSSADNGASLELLDGQATWFDGASPGFDLVDDAGEPAVGGGVIIGGGERISSPKRTEAVSPESGQLAAGETAGDLYAFGLAEGAQWISRAEKGDFTPVRTGGRGAGEFISGRPPTELTFDQARSLVTAPAPRAAIRPLRTQAPSPAQALIESGIPSNVVIGQRLRRTRIIGNPGTTGSQIRANPNVEQLIRLSGS